LHTAEPATSVKKETNKRNLQNQIKKPNIEEKTKRTIEEGKRGLSKTYMEGFLEN